MGFKLNFKFILSALLAVSMAVAVPISVEAVTPSTEEYEVSMNDTFDVFIGNQTPVTLSAGKEIYLVYTVESVDEKATTSYQHGVVASDDVTERYMYEDGGVLHYKNDSGLLEKGSTYFLKFYMAEEGLECVAVRANGEDREVIDFPLVHGEATDEYSYVGIWFGCGNVTAEFSHVLCYDENGKDLGVYSTVATVPPAKAFQYDTEVQQAYHLSVKDAYNVAICNAEKTDAEVVFMEYTVKSSESRLYQTGILSTLKPLQSYPHVNGSLLYDAFPDDVGNGYLLEPGASYIIKITREEKRFTAQVQKSVDGEYETYSFANIDGTYNPEAPYIGLWFGEGINSPVTFELTNMKCYDENGKNLGVQSNQTLVNITQKGEKSDYAGCEAMYYSQEEDTFVALYGDKTAKVTKGNETKEITYDIWDSTICFYFDGEEQLYEYAYQRFYTDEVVYNRLGTYYVKFLTGTDEMVEQQTINAQTGYIVARPTEPSREDATFEGWVLADGTEYDFDSIVSESLTLYAKWSYGITYETDTAQGDVPKEPIIAIASSVVLLAAAVVISVMIVRRGGKKNADKKEKING